MIFCFLEDLFQGDYITLGYIDNLGQSTPGWDQTSCGTHSVGCQTNAWLTVQAFSHWLLLISGWLCSFTWDVFKNMFCFVIKIWIYLFSSFLIFLTRLSVKVIHTHTHTLFALFSPYGCSSHFIFLMNLLIIIVAWNSWVQLALCSQGWLSS